MILHMEWQGEVAENRAKGCVLLPSSSLSVASASSSSVAWPASVTFRLKQPVSLVS